MHCNFICGSSDVIIKTSSQSASICRVRLAILTKLYLSFDHGVKCAKSAEPTEVPVVWKGPRSRTDSDNFAVTYLEARTRTVGRRR